MPYMIDAGAGRTYVNGLLLCMYALDNACLTCIVCMTDVGAGRTHGDGPHRAGQGVN